MASQGNLVGYNWSVVATAALPKEPSDKNQGSLASLIL